MSARGDIEKRIEREKQKILDLQSQIEKSEHFILGLLEALKFVPQDGNVHEPKRVLQPGSVVKKVEELLRQAGKPMHMDDIIRGVPGAKRPSLVSSLSRHVKKGTIFKRVGASTYSLLECDAPTKQKESIDLPPDFGKETRELPSKNEGKPVDPEDLPF